MSTPSAARQGSFDASWFVRLNEGGQGDVVTFYSYKGGTGRSMALVNCAGLIARSLPPTAKPMLLVDFDLEAPGLHRYLSPYLGPQDSGPGVIDLFEAVRDRVFSGFTEPRVDDAAVARVVDEYDLERFVQRTEISNLNLITAGRFDDRYDKRVMQFPWEPLFDKAPALFRCLGERFARDYSFTFIDSRTGLSDTSNVCTALLPGVLVIVFTPNSQSLSGVGHLVRKALEYRDASSDTRSLRVYPLASRVDNQYEDFRKLWRHGSHQHPVFGTVTGYQPMFEGIFQSVLGMTGPEAHGYLNEYFDVVQIPHTGDYSYGERLCFSAEASTDSLSIRTNYEQFLPWIVTGARPWDRPADTLVNQQGAQWLRQAGVHDIPDADGEWAVWFERLWAAVETDSSLARLGQSARVADDTRFDLLLALVLAHAYRGEFGTSLHWIRAATEEWTEDVSSAIPIAAPVQVVRLWSGRRRAAGGGSAAPTDDSHQWLTELETLLKRWYPVRNDRRLWLGAAIELAEVSGWPATRRELQEKLVVLNRNGLGEQHPETLAAMSNLARGLYADGDARAAMSLHEEVLAKRQAVLGDEHAATVASIVDLARVRLAFGEVDSAAGLQQKVLDVRRRTLGMSHPLTWDAMNDLANTLMARDEPEASTMLLREVVEAQRQALGEVDETTLTSMDRLTEGVRRLGRVEEARSLEEQTRELRRRSLENRAVGVTSRFREAATAALPLAQAFLLGRQLRFEDADNLWKELRRAGELSLARRVLARLRAGSGLVDRPPASRPTRQRLCQQEAMLTSQDTELSAAFRHDRALQILQEEFDLEDPALAGGAETLGIAGGILKRRWNDLGNSDDLRTAWSFYARGATAAMGDDAYPHINAAFIDDLLADIGDEPQVRRERARRMRQRIVAELAPVGSIPAESRWFNVATKAEAFLGLGQFAEATEVVKSLPDKPEPWQLESTAKQLATLVRLHSPRAWSSPETRVFFDTLLPGAGPGVRSAFAGKVGLALSGGGFRASFYHLGVLARLAQLDVLRHVEVLSCVSGGGIVGACYWLALRRRLLQQEPMTRGAYIDLVQELIQHFLAAVSTDLRGGVQATMPAIAWRLLRSKKGALDPEEAAIALERAFYRPLFPGTGPLFMHDLPFTPADHDPVLAGSPAFHPGRHNWLRAHKVPVLVLNATTVNTGHGWQFTPTWMGESPWSVHEAADSVPRLEWSWYEPQVEWQMALGRAVAASACVPGVFAPLEIRDAYENLVVQLVDGGVHDNQGTVSLLALDCNVLLVSDACGQLLLETNPAPGLGGLAAYASRSLSTVMERVRLATFGDLAGRRRAGLLRGLMFLHMKAGLDADLIRLQFSQQSYELQRNVLSPCGVRKDFQQALAEIRTDLDPFTPDESHALMACGYQMASWSFGRDLAAFEELWTKPENTTWPFDSMLSEITSTAATTPRRAELLERLRAGSAVRL